VEVVASIGAADAERRRCCCRAEPLLSDCGQVIVAHTPKAAYPATQTAKNMLRLSQRKRCEVSEQKQVCPSLAFLAMKLSAVGYAPTRL